MDDESCKRHVRKQIIILSFSCTYWSKLNVNGEMWHDHYNLFSTLLHFTLLFPTCSTARFPELFPLYCSIAPDLEPTMYCTGISQGGVEEWEFVLQKYRESNIGTEKRVFLQALSCASEPWILARYTLLNLSLVTSGLADLMDRKRTKVWQQYIHNSSICN